MKRSQLIALADKKGYDLTKEGEDFIYFIEKAMKNSIAKELYKYEEEFHIKGEQEKANIAYQCALKVLDERDLV